ncbi:MAG: bifunctional adenosylcobinamide kinase/adenosylcobinamide-phosphate guanylyltransferase [Alphaproteobacteria bacterium]|nr:bifunctional adenosylcobinamide kinase/adenosylcobinamide-phosphate guanylyltransferase [Alphaproteobacteria bacterium]
MGPNTERVADAPSHSTLILGGARSGKSAHAEALALACGLKQVYLATAEPGDDEMSARIAAHQLQRGLAWRTVEAPIELDAALVKQCACDTVVLVDCLTLWLSNIMATDRDPTTEIEDLCALTADLPGHVIFVANEVGLGIVPDNPLARAFRDHAGRLNQRVAASVDKVVFVAAGLPITLKARA